MNSRFLFSIFLHAICIFSTQGHAHIPGNEMGVPEYAQQAIEGLADKKVPTFIRLLNFSVDHAQQTDVDTTEESRLQDSIFIAQQVRHFIEQDNNDNYEELLQHGGLPDLQNALETDPEGLKKAIFDTNKEEPEEKPTKNKQKIQEKTKEG